MSDFKNSFGSKTWFCSLLQTLLIVYSFTSSKSSLSHGAALCIAGLVKAPLKRSRSTADGADEDSQEQLQEQLLESGGPEEEQKTDNTSLLRLLEEGEKVRERDTRT